MLSLIQINPDCGKSQKVRGCYRADLIARVLWTICKIRK